MKRIEMNMKAIKQPKPTNHHFIRIEHALNNVLWRSISGFSSELTACGELASIPNELEWTSLLEEIFYPSENWKKITYFIDLLDEIDVISVHDFVVLQGRVKH